MRRVGAQVSGCGLPAVPLLHRSGGMTLDLCLPKLWSYLQHMCPIYSGSLTATYDEQVVRSLHIDRK